VIHGNFHINDPSFDNELCRKITRAADGYVCNSIAEFDYFSSYGVSKKKMSVIPAPSVGIPENKLEKNAAKKILQLNNKKIFLYFGQIYYNKNLEFLCRVFEEYFLSDNNAILYIAGGGYSGYHLELEKIIISFPQIIHKNFIIETNINNEKKNILYSAADYFVMPSLFDSLSISIIEAWAYKIPVIVNGIKQLKAVVSENINAYIFEENSKISLLDILNKINHSNILPAPESIAEGGWNSFYQNFEKNTLIKKYIDFLTNTCNIH